MWISRQHHDLQIKSNPVGYFIPGYNSLDISRGTVLALAHYNVQNDRINRNIRLLDDAGLRSRHGHRQVPGWKAADHLDEMGFDGRL
jgi:hypothetical protein